MPHYIRLGRPAGVEVRVSVFLLAGSLVFFLFKPAVAVLALTLFVSVLLHEAAHAAVARLAGWRPQWVMVGLLNGTAYVLPPENLDQHSDTRLAASVALISLAGPLAGAASSLLLLLAVWKLGLLGGLPPQIGIIIVALQLFNLLPLFPLDGGRIAHALLIPALGVQIATTVIVWFTRLSNISLIVFGVVTNMWVVVAVVIVIALEELLTASILNKTSH